jgi:AraC family transcriptional activator of mtrCDE
MDAPADWLSRLLDMMPVRGHLDIRCFYGAPWNLPQPPAEEGVIPYHVVIGGSAVLETSDGGAPLHLSAGDMLMLPRGSAHLLHDGGSVAAMPAHSRAVQNLIISENAGTGERLDMLCGRFVLTPPHDRLLRDYLPSRIVVQAADRSASTARPGTAAQLAGLVSLMRVESGSENLGGRALLNGLSTAMFALALRLASEAADAPPGLLALAGNPRLSPALTALFNDPAHAWTLPELARLCNMSRATMARQFQEKLGRSASDLLTNIRMNLAVRELRKPSASTGAVAEAVGYQSEAAFQRAFKQRLGVTPAQWRRAAKAPVGEQE